ncbi:MAG: LysM peptidoglycan-binding domain-containing protein [Phototrophicaceae bacterium]
MQRFITILLVVMAVLSGTVLPTFAQTSQTYTVVSGDTLFRIALRFGTTVDALAQANSITNTGIIYVGQQLTLPSGSAPVATATPASTNATPAPTAVPSSGVTHTVQRGETLGSIARQYGTTFSAIATANNLANPNLIYVGQQLTIPGATAPTTSPTAVPTSTPTTSSTATYTIKSGDTLASIARQYGTTTSAIATANGITNINLIYAGQRLTIPGASGGTPSTTPTTTPSGGNTNTSVNLGTSGFEMGGHVFSFAYPDLMKNTGLTWAKVQVRYNQGDNPNNVAGTITTAKERGFKILLSVVGNKDQLAANPTQYYQDFATFLGGVAALNPDGIEVWNEQNIDREWPSGLISGTQYTSMLRAAYQAIKARNANVLVISGAPAPTGFFGNCTPAGCDDNFFIAEMKNQGAANYMDCVGIHYNEGIISPTLNSGDPRGSSSHYSRYYNGMVSLYSSTFPGKPLCFTEIGYLSADGYNSLPAGFSWASTTSVAEQSEWLSSAARIARDSRIIRLFVIWNIDSTTYGDDPQGGYAIVRPDQTCPACNAIVAALK